MASKSGQVRASGKTAAAEQAAKQAEDADKPVEITPPDEDPQDKRTKFRSPNFNRMRVNWRSEDHLVLTMVQSRVERLIIERFADALGLMSDLYDVVRTPAVDGQGEIITDQHGFVQWARTPSGRFDEDWTKLGHAQKERFLFEITTSMFDWEQRVTDAWAEAMLAKAMWEERYAIAYDQPLSGTIEDRDSVAKQDAADERYFAIAMTYYSRKADSIVRTMDRLWRTIKDTMG